VTDQGLEVVGNVAAGLPLVSKSLSLVRTSFGDCEYSSMRLGHSEQHPILQTAEPKMTAERNVAPGPDHVGVELKDSMGPLLVPASGSLKLKLVCVEEKSVMLSFGGRRLPLVGARQDNVANSDQFESLNRIGP
jgi:hypothetical protein